MEHQGHQFCVLCVGSACGLATTRKSGNALRGFELRELRAQRFYADRREANHELGVVGQCLDADHTADAELSVSYAHPGLERHAGRLILVLVRVGGCLFANATSPPAAAVRVGPKLVVREVSLIWRLRERGQLAIDELRR